MRIRNLTFTCPGCQKEINITWPSDIRPELSFTLQCDSCGWGGTLYASESKELKGIEF